MKKIILPALIFFCAKVYSQETFTFDKPDVIPVKMERISRPVKSVPEAPPDLKAKPADHENESIEKHNPVVNSKALPAGADEAVQKIYPHGNLNSPNAISVNVIANLQGLSASVNPSDNNIAVGPNHVVQMTNNSISTYLRIWDKAGNTLVNNKTVKSFSGITDYGDPNILYDQDADRYVMVLLYSRSKKKLEVCISQTPDPTGNWYVYSFDTPNGFPDYPKIGVWGNSYLITTNSTAPSIYVLNRSMMRSGSSLGSVLAFSLSKFPQIGFQAASPVSQTGSALPPAGVPASVIRVADDAWSSSLSPDHLELFNLNINWSSPSTSTITGPIKLNTIAYNSNLCGFGSGSCIPQPGTTTKLDPLSDIIMDKVQYRNFGTYEAMVCSHICNADGSGTAGIRWYELRRDASIGNWYIYQQSTYSPNTDSRFMSSITLNDKGTIALGYNVSSSTVYPGIRITGRDSCDALNSMTVPETITTPGTASSGSIRYGDYNGMVADPSDGSFWFTAQYNAASLWSTKVVHFTFTECPAPVFKAEEPQANSETPVNGIEQLSIVPNPAGDEVKVSFQSNEDNDAQIRLYDMTGRIALEEKLPVLNTMNSATLDVHHLANGYYLLKVSTAKSNATRQLVIQK